MSDNRSQVFNMTLPAKGPVAVPKKLDFRTDTKVELDFTQLINGGFVDFISGVYINNSGNDLPLSIKCGGSNQSIPFPPYASGYIPLLLTNPPRVTIERRSAGAVIQAIFYNIPMFPSVVPDSFDSSGGATLDVNLSSFAGAPLSDSLPTDLQTIDGAAIVDGLLPFHLKKVGSTVIGAALPVLNGPVSMLNKSGNLGASDSFAANSPFLRYVYLHNPVGNSPVNYSMGSGPASNGGVLLAGETFEINQSFTGGFFVGGTAGERITWFVGY